MITITTMRIVWLLRAETTTTTMLRLSSACVLRFTRSQNSVSFPVFAKLFAQTSICELIDLSMKGLTILPFYFLQKAKQTRPFCNGFLLWNELEKAVELFFYTPLSLITTFRAILLSENRSLAVEFAFSDQTQSSTSLLFGRTLFDFHFSLCHFELVEKSPTIAHCDF